MRPKFQVGDMIQSGGAPHLVFQVKIVSELRYTLAPPNDDADWIEQPVEYIDSAFHKNAREFMRQYKQYLDAQTPKDPNFDADGFPTYLNG